MTSFESWPFFCSWSGGKDSCLALYRAIQNHGNPKVLLTMLTEDGVRSRSHGLPVSLLERQAQSLGIPLVTCNSSWDDYEISFFSVISRFEEQGIKWGVFGDIDLDDHLAWVERMCSSVGIRPWEPLWKERRRDVLDEFLRLGFRATIIAVKQGVLSDCFLGRTFDRQLIADLEAAGIDVAGEEGEYHTVVTDGPNFSTPIYLEMEGKNACDGYSFLGVNYRQEG